MHFHLDAFESFCRFLFRPRRVAMMLIAAGALLVSLAAIAFAPAALAASGAAPALDKAADGKQIFEQTCTGCHTIGGGKLVGPDLKDVTKRRDEDWIKNFITDPAKMIASDPAAQQLKSEYSTTMPTLGLSPDQVETLVEYLRDPAAVGGGGQAAPAIPAGVGDPAAGQRIFLGEQMQANGGPACVACHTVSGAGALGGGALGPDLTHVATRLGQPGLAAALKTIAFPTMLGPFLNKPLTPQEQLDLTAFLANADLMQAPVAGFMAGAFTFNALRVFVIALAGATVLYVLLYFLWRRLPRNRTGRLGVHKV